MGRHQGAEYTAAALVALDLLRHRAVGLCLLGADAVLAGDHWLLSWAARLFEPGRDRDERRRRASRDGGHERQNSGGIAGRDREDAGLARLRARRGQVSLRRQLLAMPRR